MKKILKLIAAVVSVMMMLLTFASCENGSPEDGELSFAGTYYVSREEVFFENPAIPYNGTTVDSLFRTTYEMPTSTSLRQYGIIQTTYQGTSTVQEYDVTIEKTTDGYKFLVGFFDRFFDRFTAR